MRERHHFKVTINYTPSVQFKNYTREEGTYWSSEFSISQKWLKKLEQVNQQALHIWPTLLAIYCKHLRHEASVADQL